jgi:hypothetical protein
MTELGDLHATIRTDLTALLRDRGPDEVADLVVPACPEWTVKETVSHMTGVATDILSGNLEGVTTDPWTEAQVAPRRSQSLTEILDEWSEADPQVEAISEVMGDVEAQWLLDCQTHDLDVRGALDAQQQVNPRTMVFSLNFMVPGFQALAIAAGHPAIRFIADGTERAPQAEPAATAEVTSFELLRGLTGRRSADQIREWNWDTDPDPLIAAFTWGPFTMRPDPLIESV